MITATREDLETQAQQAICPCWHYELANSMDETTDIELEKIVADGQYVHKIQYYDGQITREELDEELAQCPLTNQ